MKFLKKKLIICILLFALWIPSAVAAQSLSPSERASLMQLISQLLERVTSLQEQLREMYGDSDASSADPEVTEPNRNDEYIWGEVLEIAWRPSMPGVSSINIVKDRGNKSLNIYGRKAHGDPVNTNGKFEYKLSNFYGDGEYYVELETHDGSLFESEKFSVTSEKNEGLEVESPERGDIYELTDTIKFEWGPRKPGVSTITLVSVDGGDDWGIYGRKVFGHSTNTRGYYSYNLSGMIDPGDYYAEFETPEGDVAKSGVFTIEQKELQITSPERRDEYERDSSITFRWSPRSRAVSEIKLVSKDSGQGWGIYGRKVFGHPVNTKGYYTYNLSGMIDPGEYYTQVVTEDGEVIDGDVFTISSKTEDDTTQDTIDELLELIRQTQNGN